MSRRREREKRDEKELRGEEGGVRRGTSQLLLDKRTIQCMKLYQVSTNRVVLLSISLLYSGIVPPSFLSLQNPKQWTDFDVRGV